MSNGFCGKLEQPCGDDSWGWCQACPKRKPTPMNTQDIIATAEKHAHVNDSAALCLRDNA